MSPKNLREFFSNLSCVCIPELENQTKNIADDPKNAMVVKGGALDLATPKHEITSKIPGMIYLRSYYESFSDFINDFDEELG